MKAEKEHWLVAIYGSDLGSYPTLKIFFREFSNILRTTSLNFGDTGPNLSRTEDGGGYTALVYRRINFVKVADGLQNCLTVYKLQTYSPMLDDTLFGFIPVFGPEMTKPYLEYYMRYKQWLMKDREPSFIPFLGELLSGLIATQDYSLICKEITELKVYGITDDQLLSVIEQLKDLGYPGFNPTDCKVK